MIQAELDPAMQSTKRDPNSAYACLFRVCDPTPVVTLALR
jgi:hypothetical protein